MDDLNGNVYCFESLGAYIKKELKQSNDMAPLLEKVKVDGQTAIIINSWKTLDFADEKCLTVQYWVGSI